MENKKQNFKRIAENRTSKILVTLHQLGNLTNKSYYEYDESQINKIFDAIDQESKSTRAKLLNAIKSDKGGFIL